MGRRAGFLHSLRRLRVGAVTFLLTLFIGSVFAQGEFIPASQPIPEGIRVVGTNATGVNASATARMTLGGVTSHTKFPVHIPTSTLGRLTGAAIRRGLPVVGWASLLRDLINLGGWAIDELQGQVITSPGTNQTQLAQNIWCIVPINGGEKRCANSAGQLAAVAHYYYPPHTQAPCVFSFIGTDGTARYNCGSYNGVKETKLSDPLANWDPFQYHNDNPAAVPATIATDQQLGELVKAHPQIVNAILIDPDTGAPIRTPELIAALNALAAANAAANGLDPPDPLVSDPSYGEETTPSQTDWPGFCDWATTVCDFIDWVKAEPEEDTPPEDPWEEEAEIPQQEWSSGLGGGSCPSPISFSVSIGAYTQNVEFPYTPLCEAAGWIQPLAIALCGLLGVFIVGGYRRSANA